MCLPVKPSTCRSHLADLWSAIRSAGRYGGPPGYKADADRMCTELGESTVPEPMMVDCL